MAAARQCRSGRRSREQRGEERKISGRVCRTTRSASSMEIYPPLTAAACNRSAFSRAPTRR